MTGLSINRIRRLCFTMLLKFKLFDVSMSIRNSNLLLFQNRNERMNVKVMYRLIMMNIYFIPHYNNVIV